MSRPKPCTACGAKPVARKTLRFCYDCLPGGPYPPPPCRRCGAIDDYFSAGLCSRCHQYAPQPPGSCRGCLAWGVFRIRNWLCQACIGWQEEYPTVSACRSCGEERHIGRAQACRLCWRQASDAREATKRERPYRPFDLIGANRNGQQLFFADLGRRRIPRRHRVTSPGPAPCRGRAKQLSLFDPPPNTWASRHGLPEPPRTARTRALEALVRDHAARHGWSWTHTKRTRLAVRVLAGRQRIPDAPFRASDVLALVQFELPFRAVHAVLNEAGLLEDDRVPAIVRWFDRHVADLPATMADELRIWFDVQHRGSTVPPRSRPRAVSTIRLRLRAALPALRTWADEGHESLREISRADVLAVLPPGGNARFLTVGGLRSIFSTLKARKVIFVNPTARIPSGKAERRQPLPADVDDLRAALHSTDPARAALAALLAFHALRPLELRALQLTDIRDGRLHLEHGTVLLAEPVRERVAAWLDYRNQRWPNTANPHLFVHYRTATGIGPIGRTWICRRLGTAANPFRIDRIVDEVQATGGDLRRLCDLFGLSVAAASHYIDRLDQTRIEDRHAAPERDATP